MAIIDSPIFKHHYERLKAAIDRVLTRQDATGSFAGGFIALATACVAGIALTAYLQRLGTDIRWKRPAVEAPFSAPVDPLSSSLAPGLPGAPGGAGAPGANAAPVTAPPAPSGTPPAAAGAPAADATTAPAEVRTQARVDHPVTSSAAPDGAAR